MRLAGFCDCPGCVNPVIGGGRFCEDCWDIDCHVCKAEREKEKEDEMESIAIDSDDD